MRRLTIRTLLASSLAAGCAAKRVDADRYLPLPRPRPSQTLIVDAHAHVWNAQDLAVSGFISKVKLDTDERGFEFYTRNPKQFFRDLPYEHLLEFWKLPGDLWNLVLFIGQAILTPLPEPIENFLTSTRWNYDRESPHLDYLLERRSQVGPNMPTEEGMFDHYVMPVSDAARIIVTRPTGLETYTHALVMSRSSRWENAQQVMSLYREVDIFVAALVDMDHWLDDTSETSIEEQVEMLSKVSVLADGSIMPFVAYDPRRNIAEPGRSMRNVQNAICNKGFVGIKLYPPMGFRPSGNAKIPDAELLNGDATPPDPTGRGRSFGELLDEDLGQLYAWAEEHGVPILAHANDSNGVRRGTAEYASPEYWRDVLENHPDLRVSFGHFGGVEDINSDDGKGWAKEMLDLMPAKHEVGDGGAYADVGYFDDLMERETGEEYFKGVSRLARAGEEPVTARLMYGSDWSMVALADGHPDYFRGLCVAFKGANSEDPSALRRFLGGTAADFLGLKKNQQTRERLEKFYAGKPMYAAWRDKVDAEGSLEIPSSCAPAAVETALRAPRRRRLPPHRR